MDLIDKYLTETKLAFKAAKETEWYKEGGMMGFVWAKETLQELEKVINKYNNTKFQKFIIANSIKIDTDDWHYFSNTSKKDVRLLTYVLKHSYDTTEMNLYYWYQKNSSMLKDDTLRALEYAAYKAEPEQFLKDYSRTLGFYGMSPEDAKKRLESYMARLEEKIVKKELLK